MPVKVLKVLNVSQYKLREISTDLHMSYAFIFYSRIISWVCALGSALEMSFKLLHEAQTKLKQIVHSKFDAAVHSGDVASVERFFKISILFSIFVRFS